MNQLPKVAIISVLLLLHTHIAYQEVYIVYLGEHKGDKLADEIEKTHHLILSTVKETPEEAKLSLIYSYKNRINGFAAILSPVEASKLSEMEGVMSVSPSVPGKYKLQTTRSWDFSGLKMEGTSHTQNSNILKRAKYGEGIIVGLVDTGVWPESMSFNDKGMGPVPKSWKGICQSGIYFNSSDCNKKLIGARYYLKGYNAHYKKLNKTLDCASPRDMNGHGTHTASTVGGRIVRNVSITGNFGEESVVRGGAPHARLAIYKACWAAPDMEKEDGSTCFEEDLLAALDDAISDGVDVISFSIVAKWAMDYANDGMAIGSFHAIKNNIVVAFSAGNEGPASSSLSSVAPWVITVGASTIDRTFPAPVVLGNGLQIQGQTVTNYEMDKKQHPLVYAAQVVKHASHTNLDGQCLPGSLSPEKTRGKIVVCMRGLGLRIAMGMEVKRAGGIGFILGNNETQGNSLPVDAHLLPATAVVSSDVKRILRYINSNKRPTATIASAKTRLHNKPAPAMADFSSRGPNNIDPNILKPDITAPGVNILAAWSGGDSPSKMSIDHRVVKYNIMSGTSVSCPHVAAIAALLKAIHPTWTSAAIRSAIMTTAKLRSNAGSALTDSRGRLATPFAYGAGHFDPKRAADPGLVYDATYKDYLIYLCGYGAQKMDPTFKCPEKSPSTNNLNYPSVAIPEMNGTVTVKRTVTNVGHARGVYFLSVHPPIGYSVKVRPSVLAFNGTGQKKTFTITVKARDKEVIVRQHGRGYAFGWYTWKHQKHIVRSPLAVSLAKDLFH